MTFLGWLILTMALLAGASPANAGYHYLFVNIDQLAGFRLPIRHQESAVQNLAADRAAKIWNWETRLQPGVMQLEYLAELHEEIIKAVSQGHGPNSITGSEGHGVVQRFALDIELILNVDGPHKGFHDILAYDIPRPFIQAHAPDGVAIGHGPLWACVQSGRPVQQFGKVARTRRAHSLWTNKSACDQTQENSAMHHENNVPPAGRTNA